VAGLELAGAGLVELLVVARETVYLVNISMALDAFDLGYLMGLAVGEGSFTGDKQQPAFQLRMTEEDPEPIRRVNRLIGGSVYGPYNHSERRYFVLMLRGPALWRATTLFYEAFSGMVAEIPGETASVATRTRESQ
jgi:hypothetical protein